MIKNLNQYVRCFSLGDGLIDISKTEDWIKG